jgi:hypothetical protein
MGAVGQLRIHHTGRGDCVTDSVFSSWTEILNVSERISTFGNDPEGQNNRFELPGLSAFAVAMERLLPGDELVTLESDCMIVSQLKEVHPTGMHGDGMTWTKKLQIKRKRRVRGQQSYWREVKRFMPVGVQCKITKMCDGLLVELTYEDGHKAFLVGILGE